ncbi:hypothetical protein B0H16DRAFT_1761467 [Mycena metata]|uniref:MYND-type domain-containing protein n=1 Tax=Mycena metata TaxID=1033252 RepID=A0AAD7IA02_9AGAR|nr:hypothetical protein B0H16DRAFT_1761467 [Mycena metata]
MSQRSPNPAQLFSSLWDSSLDKTVVHDSNCGCDDPKTRLTRDTLDVLKEFGEKLAKSSSPVTDDDITFVLQYLKASDIPAAGASCCAQTIGNAHAMLALAALSSMLSTRGPFEPLVQRLAQAWPDIQQWIEYMFAGCLIIGKIQAEKGFMVSAYNHLVNFFTVIALGVPEIRTLALTEPNRERTLSMLMFCWLIEDSMTVADGKKPFLSAAFPLTQLLKNDHKPKAAGPIDLFRALKGLRKEFDPLRKLIGVEFSPDRIAQNALSLLRSPANTTSGHSGIPHVRMLNFLAVGDEYSDALLAQHSVRDVTRYLSQLISTPEAPTSGITACLEYLATYMPTKDGFSNARMALQAGLLPAILRSEVCLSDDDSETRAGLEKLLHIISLYIIYPSVLHSFLVSVQKIKDLDDIDRDGPVYAAYQKIVRLVDDRLVTTQRRCSSKIDMGCGKDDNSSTLRGCTGCFNVSYCSENCQKQHWSRHEHDCKATKALRKAGKPLEMSQSDADGIFYLAMAQINLRSAEIARAWKEEGPTRTPLVSFDFTEDPLGVMLVGKRCLDTPPSKTRETGVYNPEMKAVVDGSVYFNSLWLETISRKVHDEHGIVCVYLPQGDTPKGKWMCFATSEELDSGAGTVFEKLVQYVEDGFDYGEPHPDPVF